MVRVGYRKGDADLLKRRQHDVDGQRVERHEAATIATNSTEGHGMVDRRGACAAMSPAPIGLGEYS